MNKAQNEKGRKKPFFSAFMEQQLPATTSGKVKAGADPKGGYYTKPGSWDCIINEP